jgi:hypothetical protein
MCFLRIGVDTFCTMDYWCHDFLNIWKNNFLLKQLCNSFGTDLIITLVFEENANLFTENWDHNIDPWDRFYKTQFRQKFFLDFHNLHTSKKIGMYLCTFFGMTWRLCNLECLGILKSNEVTIANLNRNKLCFVCKLR